MRCDARMELETVNVEKMETMAEGNPEEAANINEGEKRGRGEAIVV